MFGGAPANAPPGCLHPTVIQLRKQQRSRSSSPHISISTCFIHRTCSAVKNFEARSNMLLEIPRIPSSRRTPPTDRSPPRSAKIAGTTDCPAASPPAALSTRTVGGRAGAAHWTPRTRRRQNSAPSPQGDFPAAARPLPPVALKTAHSLCSPPRESALDEASSGLLRFSPSAVVF
jgi:hypothetical protein